MELNIFTTCRLHKGITMNKITTKNWMSSLNGNITLDKISIPGTHDSGTAKTDKGAAHTQNFGIATQLNDGIRFLDIRVVYDGTQQKDPLRIYHGIISCKLSFGNVLDSCMTFFAENPQETIVMLMNSASGTADNIQQGFTVYTEQERYKSLFYLNENLAPLSELRGKIVLFRRFSGKSLGINLSGGWKDNRTFTLVTPQNQTFKIEDQYKQHDTHKKLAAVEELIGTAMQTPDDGIIYITYNSIAQGTHTPYQYAWGGGFGPVNPKMNPGLNDFLNRQQKNAELGIIMLDFYNNEKGNIDNRLVECIINSNKSTGGTVLT